MSDFLTKTERSLLMAKIKYRNTKVEELGFALLRLAGLRFKRHPKNIFGSPDAANKSRKIAVFIDSEFWHGRDWKKRKRDFKSNKKFWMAKIERNIARDKEVTRRLRREGWKVIRVWSKDLRSRRAEATLRRLKKILSD